MTCFHPKTAWQKKTMNIDEQKNRVEQEIQLTEFGFIKKPRIDRIKYCGNKIIFAKQERWLGKILYKYKDIILDEKQYLKIEIPCGKCIGCKLDRANDWATKCVAESKQWKNNCFITLTYNNENLKSDKIIKKDIQDFWKRLRYYEKGIENWENPKNNKIEKPIRYICCGEYGGRTHRPHFHAGIFNWKPNDLKYYKTNKIGDDLYTSKTLEKIWKKGYVVIGEMTTESARYIANYTIKKSGKTKEQDEFVQSSTNPGLGIKYFNDNKEKILRNYGIYENTKKGVKLKTIPRLMKKYLKMENWNQLETLKYKNQQQAIENDKKIMAKTTKTKAEYLKMKESILWEKIKELKLDRRENLI